MVEQIFTTSLMVALDPQNVPCSLGGACQMECAVAGTGKGRDGGGGGGEWRREWVVCGVGGGGTDGVH